MTKIELDPCRVERLKPRARLHLQKQVDEGMSRSDIEQLCREADDLLRQEIDDSPMDNQLLLEEFLAHHSQAIKEVLDELIPWSK